MTTFVSVGNAHQPFSRLIDAVVANSDKLPQPVIVQHGHSHCVSSKVRPISFLDMDDFKYLLYQASLLILHAGCGVLIHAMRCGKIPVVMTRRKKFGEMIDDHQVELAEALAAERKIVLVPTAEELLPAVGRATYLAANAGGDPGQPRSFRLIQALLRQHQRNAVIR